MKVITYVWAGILMVTGATADPAKGETTSGSVRLWAEDAPGALGNRETDIPTLTPFLVRADSTTSKPAAVLVCPGGGYAGLAPYEGADYARWLNELGVNAFVLKYRLGSAGYRHPVMLEDASRALRTIRERAGEWGVDAECVGIMGSSAGGHLASTLLTHFDPGNPDSTDTVERQSCRPDFGILCYPVITLGKKTHGGSRQNLLGSDPSADLVQLLSNELQVTRETPPTFLFHTADDPVVPVDNSQLFAAALAREKVPFALHVYPHGPHGTGLGTHEWNPSARHPWTSQCTLWLRDRGVIK